MTSTPPPTTNGWNLADVFERIADQIPDELAQRQGGRAFTWAQFDRRADGVARALLDADLIEQDKVAQYLYNCPEYVESVLAAFKAGMATVNTNYRYTADELVYLWDNADVVAVVFHGTFVPNVDEIRDRLPRIRVWLWVDDGTHPCPDWAAPYEAAARAGTDRTYGAWGRSGDHLFLLYTGGTTGMPKGVMWRQDDMFLALDAANRRRMPPEQNLDAVGNRVVRAGPRGMPGAPLMHGTGLFNAISTLMIGGSVTTMEGRHFDPVELLDTVERYRINSVSIVGDAFAKPILRALDAEPDRWDVASLRVIFSSGVIWSKETKDGLLRHNPRLIMVDALGSSEAIGMATNTTTAESGDGTARFELGPNARVVTDDGRDVLPGSGEIGRVALRGYTPIGYYKDPEKSATTFQVIDGERYSIPGDSAEVLADGTVQLLGRGSQCINTGGEKVYPEEVEECLKLHPAVADAAVVGVPDERFGEAINAIVELHPGAATARSVPTADVPIADVPIADASIEDVPIADASIEDVPIADVPIADASIADASIADASIEDELIDHVKHRLARYKAPKVVHLVPSVGRAVNGKLDYRTLKAYAVEHLPGS